MLSFREFYQICEGKKSNLPPNAIPGSYKEHPDGTKTYTLPIPKPGTYKPLGAKKVKKLLDTQGGIGGKAIEKAFPKKKEKDKKKKK